MRKEYLPHHYLIENDKFQWSRIVDSFRVCKDLPSRLSWKFAIFSKLWTPNFNKDQYSPHGSVAHYFEERV